MTNDYRLAHSGLADRHRMARPLRSHQSPLPGRRGFLALLGM